MATAITSIGRYRYIDKGATRTRYGNEQRKGKHEKREEKWLHLVVNILNPL